MLFLCRGREGAIIGAQGVHVKQGPVNAQKCLNKKKGGLFPLNAFFLAGGNCNQLNEFLDN